MTVLISSVSTAALAEVPVFPSNCLTNSHLSCFVACRPLCIKKDDNRKRNYRNSKEKQNTEPETGNLRISQVDKCTNTDDNFFENQEW